MRKLIAIEYLSLDGVTQAPGYAGEDPDGHFAHAGWTGPLMDDHRRYMREALDGMGAPAPRPDHRRHLGAVLAYGHRPGRGDRADAERLSEVRRLMTSALIEDSYDLVVSTLPRLRQ